ncbi:MAG: CinA family protein [Actinomycetota bacterium]|jgi:nicotinamide-nucleotide amidase
MTTSVYATTIIETLKARGETVSVAESLTGGGLGHALTQVPGASQVFLGGIIAYTADVKVNFLGVPRATIDQFTVVSEEVAVAMADGAREKIGTTWAISTTGIAGPGDYMGVREGTVWIAISGPINQTLQLTLDGGRDGVRQGAISSAIGNFARILTT